MMQKFKRPLSILLSLLMVVSLFAVVPITASAEEEQCETIATVESKKEFSGEHFTVTADNAGSSGIMISNNDKFGFSIAGKNGENITKVSMKLGSYGIGNVNSLVFSKGTLSKDSPFTTGSYFTANDVNEKTFSVSPGNGLVLITEVKIYYTAPVTTPADDVKELIDALPAEITLDSKTDVVAARTAYDALSDTEKAKVDADTLKKLTDAEAAIKEAEDVQAADAVCDLIDALPAAVDVTVDDKAAIDEAKAAYDALTDDQKALLEGEVADKLTDDLAALATAEDVQAAAAVTEMIQALPAAVGITLDDKADVEAARAAYDALTADQKALVSPEDVMALELSERVLAMLEVAAEDQAAAAAVSEQIKALPAAADVTVDDMDAIEEVSAAYDALNGSQKALVPLGDKMKLTAVKGALAAAVKAAEDEAASEAVEDLIRALPAAEDVTLDDQPAIEEAKAAYDALTADQKKLVNLTDRVQLAADVAAIEKLVNDIAAADAVTEQINALPDAADITLDDAADVMAARAAYEALTDDQKALVDDAVVQKLNDAEDALFDLVDANAVSTMINALPDADDVSVHDKDLIEAVRAAYDDLSDAQKALIDEDTYKKLTDAEDALAQAEADKAAAEEVDALIEALPAPTQVTVDDKEAIEAARAAFDELTDNQKNLVSMADKVKLALDEYALANAEKAVEDEQIADVVEDMINALPAPDEVTLDDKPAIEAARAAYNDLTDDQKKFVSLVNRVKLVLDEAAVEKIEEDIAAAEAVKDMIDALPAAEDVTADDAADIIAARAAYEALTDDQKALVDDETVQKLTDDEAALEDVMEVEAVKAMIDALPEADDVTYRDKDAIEAAREAYDALSDEQKAQIDEDTVKKLTDAEEALAKAEADKEAADAVDEMIKALPNPLRVTADDKDAIEAARAAFNDLTNAQKTLVPFVDKVKLALDEAALEAIQKLADEAAAKAVKDMIDALPAAEDITSDDKAAVEEARAAYDALTDNQKALIDEDTLKKLTDAEAKLNHSAILGDADGNGVVDITDVSTIQMQIAGMVELDDTQRLAADVNQDGVIDINDATILQLYIANVPVDYPIGEEI